jgi:hypothetical protein
MTTNARNLASLIVCVSALTVSVPAGAQEPAKGTYWDYNYVAVSTCSEDTPHVGPALIVHWPGPSANGFKLYLPANDGSALTVISFPTTPSSGVTNWSGTAKGITYPGGTKKAEMFTATLSYATTTSFLIAYTHPIKCDDGSDGMETDNFVLASTAA